MRPVRRRRVWVLALLSGLAWPMGTRSARALEAPPPVRASSETGVAAGGDPAAGLVAAKLGPDEERLFRGLFEKLAAPDFETRENALQRLIARGPAVLALAAEFAQNPDAETAAQAGALRGRILLGYDGYLPSVLDLPRLLKLPLPGNGTKEHARAWEALQRLAREQKFNLYLDPSVTPRPFPLERWNPDAAGLCCATLLQLCGLQAVVRGDVLVLTAPETARRLGIQRHTCDWKELKLDRAEARRVGEELRAFFPEGGGELHTGSEALSVRGPPEALARAARLLALLKPGSSAAQWPAAGGGLTPAQTAGLLAVPVTTVLNGDDLGDALADWRKQGAPVRVLVDGQAWDGPPYPPEIQGLAPLTLTLRGVPLGLALRWLARRTAFVGALANERALHAETGPDGRPQLRAGPKAREPLRWAVGGADAEAILPEADAQDLGERADGVRREKLAAALRPHLELFPDFEIENDLRVVRGRVLVQGSPTAVGLVLELVARWKEEGKAPACAWSEALAARLERRQDWDGRGLSAGKLLPRLRAWGGVTLLLEDSPEGEAAHFKLTPEQAQLFPPGPHTLRELLDRLADVAGARWELRWGVVVVSPAARKPRVAPVDTKKGASAEGPLVPAPPAAP